MATTIGGGAPAEAFKLGRFAAGGCSRVEVGFFAKANAEDEFGVGVLFTGGWVFRWLPAVFGLAKALSPKLVDFGGEKGFVFVPVFDWSGGWVLPKETCFFDVGFGVA